MEITGTIKNVFPVQTGTSKQGNQWVKQEFVVEYIHGQYPKAILLSTMDSNVVGKLQIGQEVAVKFDFTVREWTNQQGVKKYFNEPQIWRDGLHAIAPQQYAQPAPQAYPQQQYQQPQQAYQQPAQPMPQQQPVQPQQPAPQAQQSDLPF